MMAPLEAEFLAEAEEATALEAETAADEAEEIWDLTDEANEEAIADPELAAEASGAEVWVATAGVVTETPTAEQELTPKAAPVAISVALVQAVWKQAVTAVVKLAELHKQRISVAEHPPELATESR